MKAILRLFLFFPCTYAIAQTDPGLSVFRQFRVHGGSTIIGNTIVGVHPKRPYNKTGSRKNKNDALFIRYVDIDKNGDTFSSSAANLEWSGAPKEVVSATLYWTATYPYERGTLVKKDQEGSYIREIERLPDFDEVLFQLPDDHYHRIKGVVLKDLRESIGEPYVCFADVTDLLKNAQKVVGTYTVANIRAAQGQILGGSSGGWMLSIVYKDDQEPLRDIQLFHGLKALDKANSPFDIRYGRGDGHVIGEGSLSLGVLEGDLGLKTDKVAVLSDGRESLLKTAQRPYDNFFNSTIAHSDRTKGKRNPNSQNTLGFDLAVIGLEHNGGPLKGNGDAVLDIRFESTRDLLFLFFMAVETVLPEGQEMPLAGQGQKESVELVSRQAPMKAIPDTGSAYYLVTNVFENHQNAVQWKQRLEEMGFTPGTFVNLQNYWEYIYIVRGDEKAACAELYDRLREEPEFKEIWIMEVKGG